jgi:hypothetical protein
MLQKGSKVPLSRRGYVLLPEVIQEIQHLHFKEGVTKAELGRRYGVSGHTIGTYCKINFDLK